MPGQEVENPSALDAAFDACRGRIGGFVERHYRYPGAWQTNRHALGWDLARAPLNLLWAPVYVCAVLAAAALRRPAPRFAALLERMPAGLTTRVQRHLDRRLREELLAPLSTVATEARGADSDHLRLLDRYASTRTASADIGNTLASAAFGAVALKQFTPGGIAIGLLLASWFARQQQVDSFVLGPTLGAWYAALFPASPGPLTLFAGILVVLCCLAVFASLSGLITDPLQARLGLHQRRLRSMLDHLQRDLAAAGSNYRPRDPLLARALELFDLLRSPFS